MKTRTAGVMLTFLMIVGAGISAMAMTMAAVPAPMPIEDFSGLERINPPRCGA